jgi:DNA-binding transcriptional LysR family regulator
MAEHYPKIHVTLTRGSPEQQLVQLRTHQLEALVVDPRYIAPASDLRIEQLVELPACFVSRSDHPLAHLSSVSIRQILAFPVACAPLSDEIVRLLTQQYGPEANPAQMASLQCEDVQSLLAAVERSQTVFLGIAAAAKAGLDAGQLVALPVTPPFRAAAHFAYVSLVGRTAAPAMQLFRQYVSQQFS